MHIVSTGTQLCDKCGKPLGVLRVATWYGTFHQGCAGFSAASTDPRDDRIAELEARNRKLEKALRPFAEAYEQFAKNEHCTRVLSLGQLGRLAAGELSGAHFKTASAALSTKEDGT